MISSTSLGTLPVFVKDGKVILVDQRHIPEKLDYFDATRLDDMCYAIREMVVRGAPSIGVAAALGLASEASTIAQALKQNDANQQEEFFCRLGKAKQKLDETRPTAVNLHWATNLVFEKAKGLSLTCESAQAIAKELFIFAESLIIEHANIHKKLGDLGATLVGKRASVMTHCNTGPLATCGWGSAFGVIKSAHMQGSDLTVYVNETRPRQQGARLTTWELLQEGIQPILVTDSMAGYLMAQGKVDFVFVGADRIAANGDTANKIGTYSLAVLAHYHKVPFYVCAPLSSIDSKIASGAEIVIEERDASEVTIIGGKSIAPAGTQAYNPAFDVTPANLISGIICEAGILREPFTKAIAQLQFK
jgi:methylthioribose-1-phosphate isomerase